MLHITSLSEGLEIFKALGSDVRIEILNILLEESNINMNELASRLNITNGALTNHIKKLESCGLITASGEAAGHGNQKICSIIQDKILVELEKELVSYNCQEEISGWLVELERANYDKLESLQRKIM